MKESRIRNEACFVKNKKRRTSLVVWTKMVLENDGDKCSTKTSQADTMVADGAIARVWMIARYLGFSFLSFFFASPI